MYEFFHGWRRRVGIVTLVMACCLMAGWVRNYVMCDVFSIHGGRSNLQRFVSVQGRTWWMDVQEQDGSLCTRWHQCSHNTNIVICRPEDLTWRRNFGGFELGEFPEVNIGSATYAIVPYWSLVVPLTLLSACLILCQPAKRVRHDA
jgi:hypothetical protein